MIKPFNKNKARIRRHKSIRKAIAGTSTRPRLCVSKSNKNISAQLIDDTKGITIASASTLEKEVKTKAANVEAAKEVGKLIAKRAKENKIEEVVFDRAGYLYHGAVKALAEAARGEGLKF